MEGKFKQAGKIALEGIGNVTLVNPYLSDPTLGIKSFGAKVGEQWKEGFEKGVSIKPKKLGIFDGLFTSDATGINTYEHKTPNPDPYSEMQSTASGIASGGSRATNITIHLGKLNEK
ncbi:MAG: hypothetical protein HC896_00255 [Bacteroidales bacterium]|nr:hypothetical protein [Bacteroidales bacterium]